MEMRERSRHSVSPATARPSPPGQDDEAVDPVSDLDPGHGPLPPGRHETEARVRGRGPRCGGATGPAPPRPGPLHRGRLVAEGPGDGTGVHGHLGSAGRPARRPRTCPGTPVSTSSSPRQGPCPTCSCGRRRRRSWRPPQFRRTRTPDPEPCAPRGRRAGLSGGGTSRGAGPPVRPDGCRRRGACRRDRGSAPRPASPPAAPPRSPGRTPRRSGRRVGRRPRR